MSRFHAYLLIVALVLMPTAACAHSGARARTLESLVGVAAPEQVVEQFGLPEQREVFGDREVWVYLFDRQQYQSPNSGYHFTTADRVTLTFDGGHLVSWESEGCVGDC